MTQGVALGGDVDSATWRSELTARLAEGFDYPDFLTGFVAGPDRLDHVVIVVQLRRSQGDDVAFVRTSVPAESPELACLCGILPGLAWHERETAEMFGVRFVGGVEHPPLLTDGTRMPLRKESPLSARIETPWPGTEGARRVRVPGVSELWREDA